MAKKKSAVEPAVPQSEFVQALTQAIEATKPIPKKTVFNRKKGTPWTPKDGSPKLKLKRKMYQHGLLIDVDRASNEEIDWLNKLKPGIYLDGHVKVNKRKDRGLDIDYPVKTASQRLRLINRFGIRDFKDLVERLALEAANPKKEESTVDED